MNNKKSKIFVLIIFVVFIALLRIFWSSKIFSSTNSIPTNMPTNIKENINLNTNTNTPSNLDNKTNESRFENYEILNEYKVPILMYHYIRDFNDPSDELGFNLSVSPESFEKQIKYLSELGYTSISLKDLASKKFPKKSVIITFDDGYKDAYDNAFPILKKYNFTGTFYIITSKVGHSEYVTWDNLVEMNKNDMIIASHSTSHPNMASISVEKITSELTSSKKVLEDKLNIKVTDFCYPSGKYSVNTIEELEKSGYNSAVTTKSGIATQDNKLYELPRIRVTNSTILETIIK